MTNDRIREVYNRVVPILAVIALVFAVVAVGWSWQNSAADHRQDVQRDKDQDAATTANLANAVTNCENANESRQASRTLWNFVLDLSLSGGDADAAELSYLGQVRTWINTVYQPHDCQRLDKEYKIPDPPTIPAMP